jgi:phosphatidylglycerophosphate synthase
VRQWGVLQQIAGRTGGIVTPANVLDGVALLGAKWSGPRLETWPGILAGIASYTADMADGSIARRTGTASRVGDIVDHVGDKPKVAYALFHIWRKGLADRPLIAATAVYNGVTASITVYDRVSKGSSHVEVSKPGKRAMFTSATGVGMQTIASKVAVHRPAAGAALRSAGAAIGYSGLLIFGLPTIRQYWRMAQG